MAENVSFVKVIGESLNRPKTVRPPGNMPSKKTQLAARSASPVVTWFGHSSYLVQIDNKNILVDPVFSGHASPVSWLVKAFAGADVYNIHDIPFIDLLIITHNHYDHLDTATVRKLKGKIGMVYTALGVGRDIPFIDGSKIFELDWWESASPAEGMTLTALPARHFSGRGIKRGGSLWTSFALRTNELNVYIGGDSGYDGHFKQIGERFGPFDLAVLECGQYNESWPYIHMMPEQTVQAAIDLKARVLLPVHWGKFTLANHPWDEPIQRIVREAERLNVTLTTPMIGEPVRLDQNNPRERWWLTSQ